LTFDRLWWLYLDGCPVVSYAEGAVDLFKVENTVSKAGLGAEYKARATKDEDGKYKISTTPADEIITFVVEGKSDSKSAKGNNMGKLAVDITINGINVGASVNINKISEGMAARDDMSGTVDRRNLSGTVNRDSK